MFGAVRGQVLRLKILHKTSRFRRTYTDKTPPSSTGTANVKQARFERFISRTPRFLHGHLNALRTAPLSHITAFLLLHEITAVIPLFGLAGAFHYYHWLPPYFAEGEWVLKGVELFGRYFRRKGWITDSDEKRLEQDAQTGDNLTEIEKQPGKFKQGVGKWFGRGEEGTRLVIEFATAYAIVKVFMPLRLVISAWGAPWFARWTVLPVGNAVKRWFAKGTK